MVTAFNDHRAIDQHIIDPAGYCFGLVISRRVRNGIRIEHHTSAPVAFPKETSIFEAENLRRQRCHLADRVFQLKDLSSRCIYRAPATGPKTPRMGLPGYFWFNALPSDPMEIHGTCMTVLTSSSDIV